MALSAAGGNRLRIYAGFVASCGRFVIPKGLDKIAQGCRAAATLGRRPQITISTLKGLHNSATPLKNPVGVFFVLWSSLPRVAAARQPWAILFKPFGLSRHQSGLSPLALCP
jgi:hypothetical protein